jgi:hypothetical protein
MQKTILFLLILIGFTSCVEIFDDISFKSDGSGTFKYNVNLSSSKLKINSILALDSLDGKKVPSLNEIKAKIEEYRLKLEEKEGITNVKVETNFTEFILRFSCDFKSADAFQDAIKEIVTEESKDREMNELKTDWLTWEPGKMQRSVPTLTTKLTERLKKEDAEALKKGNYVSITRFDKPIERTENTNAKISPNKMAVMIKTNPYSLVQNIALLENTIYFNTTKKDPK